MLTNGLYMHWKHSPMFSGHHTIFHKATSNEEPVPSYRNALTFDMGTLSIMVADDGVERDRFQVIVPKGSMGEEIIDEIKMHLQHKQVIFSSGLESSHKEINARYVFLGNGVVPKHGPVNRITKQQVMLILEEMQHTRGIQPVKLPPSPDIATIESMQFVGMIKRTQLNMLQKSFPLYTTS